MEITFYKNMSESNRIGKTLNSPLVVEGNFRGEVNVIDPSITVSTNKLNLDEYNYCYIPTLGRYYFIVAEYIPRTSAITLELHIDVLETYKDDILRHSLEVVESDNSNPYYSGYSVGVDVRKEIEKKEFNTPFSENGEFVLIAINGVRG